MTPAPSPADPENRDARWLWLFFAAAWCGHFAFSLVGWDATLLGLFQFRQAQTALATAHFPVEGFPLAYDLPLFGPPWSMPLEFPLYQASVARFAEFTGLALEPAGRLVSWLYFQAGLPALFLLLGSAGIRRPLRWLTMALVVTSPIYIFYSRSFLIESLAWSAGLWFLAAFGRLLDRPHLGWWVVAALAGSLSATVKVTTWAVFALAAGLWFLARLWAARGAGPRPARPGLLRAVLAVLPSLAAGLAWTAFARSVRAHNPEVAFLDSHFGWWSFGDLAQRFSWAYWHRTTEIWMTCIVSDAGLAVGLLFLARATRAHRCAALLAFAAFLAAQLVFSNLYYVHDYYFYASAVFLVLALGLLLQDFFVDPAQPRWLRLTLPVLLVLFQLGTYSRTYLSHQRTDLPAPEYMQAVSQLTRPDDVIVVVGQDWDPGLAFYTGRKALMLLSGRESDPAGIRRSLERLNPRSVGAVLFFGEFRNRVALARDAFAPLDLGAEPLLISDQHEVGIWIPRLRLAETLERLPFQPYGTLQYNPPPAPSDGFITLGRRQIASRREFRIMEPRPQRARGAGGFSYATVGITPVLNAHAPFELDFPVPAGARTFEATVGIHEGAYTDANGHTDGVTFEVVQHGADGAEQVLHSVHLDPHARPDQRGPQALTVTLPGAGGGTLTLRSNSGPAGNAGFDWAYVASARFR